MSPDLQYQQAGHHIAASWIVTLISMSSWGRIWSPAWILWWAFNQGYSCFHNWPSQSSSLSHFSESFVVAMLLTVWHNFFAFQTTFPWIFSISLYICLYLQIPFRQIYLYCARQSLSYPQTYQQGSTLYFLMLKIQRLIQVGCQDTSLNDYDPLF